jgi:hypothetical protein
MSGVNFKGSMTLRQLNTFLTLLAEPRPESTSVPHGEGWYRPGFYKILHGESQIGTFKWHIKGLTDLRMHLKFPSMTVPTFFGASLDHDEAVLKASTFWERQRALERLNARQFHTVPRVEIHHVSIPPFPSKFVMEKSVVFQAREGMEFYFCTDGSKMGVIVYVKGIESFREEDVTELPGDAHDPIRFTSDALSDPK